MKFTQKMIMHMNGDGFSHLHYRIHADGKETEIVRRKTTNGRPEYKTISDKFHFGDEILDALTASKNEMIEWLTKRATKTTGKKPDIFGF